MAREEIWEKLRYFKPSATKDLWGDADAISDILLLRLDDFRHFLGVPIFVTSGVRPETDGKSSYHTRRKGACAVDVIAPDFKGEPIDLILTALRFGFTGLGYYPDWQYNGVRVGGLHLDMRPLGMDADGTQNYAQSLWIGVKTANGQRYVAMNTENLNRFCKVAK